MQAFLPGSLLYKYDSTLSRKPCEASKTFSHGAYVRRDTRDNAPLRFGAGGLGFGESPRLPVARVGSWGAAVDTIRQWWETRAPLPRTKA